MQHKWLTIKDVRNIPADDLPLLVLSDNTMSLLSLGIKFHQRGAYNHLMWMRQPGYFATQDMLFKEVPINKYLTGKHRLKFWSFNFSEGSKNFIRNMIYTDLCRPWYKRLYDPLQIIGKLFRTPKLQLPYFDICSDKAKYLRHVDKTFCADVPRHRSPSEINHYLQKRLHTYFVYGRHVSD